MEKGCKRLAAHLGIVLVLSVCVVLGAGEATAAPIIHSCTFEASGDGCLFDLVATGGGGLKVDTKAGTAGDRWRTTLVVVDTKTVDSHVGTGSATSFTGLVQRTMANGKRYEVMVAYEFPLSGTLPDPFPPTSVEVRFSGPAVDQLHMTITGPRPRGPGALAGPPAPVAQTGQTQCWDPSGSRIDCAGTGEDGDIQAGVPFPTPRFTDHLNGTVTDHLTGLIWLKNAECFGPQTWADALTAANTLADDPTSTTTDCGLTDGSEAGDWRLPNIKELQSLIDYDQHDPALPAGHPFSLVDGGYWWSSTTHRTQLDSAVVVTLINGATIDAAEKVHFTAHGWPVRGGQ
jgi:Protein of unknown function (DUF1566)